MFLDVYEIIAKNSKSSSPGIILPNPSKYKTIKGVAEFLKYKYANKKLPFYLKQYQGLYSFTLA